MFYGNKEQSYFLHRLDEEPSRRTVLQDLTCDSDGRIDHYVDEAGVDTTLPLHAFQPGDDYLLGIFLVGAYQETLGDIHNLFGDTDSVDVEIAADGSHRLLNPEHGDTVEDVLRYVHYNPRDLAAAYRAKTYAANLDDGQEIFIGRTLRGQVTAAGRGATGRGGHRGGRPSRQRLV